MASALVSTVTRLRSLARLDPAGVLEAVGRAYPRRPLLRPDEPLPYAGYGGEWLTGGQLRDLGRALAHALRAHGVAANTRVVVCTGNRADYLLHLHAVVAAGGVPVSVNDRAGWEFVVAVVARTGAAVVVTDGATLAGCPPAERAALRDRGTVLCLSGPGPGGAAGTLDAVDTEGTVDLVAAVAAAPAGPLPRRAPAAETAIALFHTSGTTGTPKLCVWNARNTRRIWKIMMATLPSGARSRVLLAVPFSHALYFALGTGLLLCGARVYGQGRLEPDEFLAAIATYRASSVFAFPHLYMRAVAAGLDGHDLRSVRVWATGADKAHAAHIAALIRQGGRRPLPWLPRGSVFLDSYGSTEIGAGGIMQLWLPGSTPEPCVQGRPMPTQFAYRIVGPDWRDVPRGEEGRILVRSTTRFGGYWNDHDTWVASALDGWWWAGDVGRVDRKGRLLFLDREADSVPTAQGVLRTLPVEERLLTHPRVMEAAVYRAGRTAAAVVAPRGVLVAADLAALGEDEVRRLEAELLAYANRDRPGPPLDALRVVALAEIPFGVTGKVLKNRLRAGVPAPDEGVTR